MGRSEIALASRFREVTAQDFQNAESLRSYIIAGIKEMRKWQQKGVVAQFSKNGFDASIMDFVKIGHGIGDFGEFLGNFGQKLLDANSQ